jgi:hypothetical protein
MVMMLPNIQNPIHSFVELLKRYEVYFSDDLARELLRVHLTKTTLQESMQPITSDTAYEVMRNLDMDLFHGDQEMFWECFQSGYELDFHDTLLAIYQEDRTGVVIVPDQVTAAFSEQISMRQAERILIPEAHKFLRGLFELVNQYLYSEFVLLAENYLHQQILRFLFKDCTHVEVQIASLYSYLELEPFDFILALPAFGRKSDVESERFVTRESEGVAVENLLELLRPEGELSIILPARFTFSGGSFAKLRKQIASHYGILGIYTLPSGTLRPYTMMKTYVIQIQRECVDEVKIGEFRTVNERFQAFDQVTITARTFAQREDWRLEVILSEVESSKSGDGRVSQLPTTRLREIAELFRGRSILKTHIQPLGEIQVLNISNIEAGEITWDNLDRISEDFAKIRRYALQAYDLVLSCRGTINKVAVVTSVTQKVIASANIIVVRFTNQPELWSYYVKIFLETTAGLQTLRSFQRGTTVMNMNPADLGELEIPVLGAEEMEKLVKEYIEEQQIYRSSMKRAQSRWQDKKSNIYQKLN